MSVSIAGTNPPSSAAGAAAAGQRPMIRSILIACSGNAVEWFDFFAYAFTALYFAPAFFPSGDTTSQLLNTAGIFAASVVISGLCSLLAMGGAVMTVPFMLRWRIPMIQAIGTAAAVGFPIAVGGTAGYIASGWGLSMPRWTLGFVYLPALAALTCASVLAAPLGARIAHRLPEGPLRMIFSGLLVLLAGRMVGNLW